MCWEFCWILLRRASLPGSKKIVSSSPILYLSPNSSVQLSSSTWLLYSFSIPPLLCSNSLTLLLNFSSIPPSVVPTLLLPCSLSIPLGCLSNSSIQLFSSWQNDLSEVRIHPILFEKGDSKLAVFGLGALREERLHRLWREKKVRFLVSLNMKKGGFFCSKCIFVVLTRASLFVTCCCPGAYIKGRPGRPWTPLVSDCKWCRTVNGVGL